MTATKTELDLNLAWARPLRERASEALIAQWRLANPPSDRTRSSLLAAQQLARSAEQYRARHCAGYDNIPGYWEWAETVGPNLGINNHPPLIYLCLRNQALRAMAAATGQEYEPTPTEVDATCAGWWPRRSPSCPDAPTDGRGVPGDLVFVAETKKGFPLFSDGDGRLMVRDSRGGLIGYSGSLDRVTLA